MKSNFIAENLGESGSMGVAFGVRGQNAAGICGVGGVASSSSEGVEGLGEEGLELVEGLRDDDENNLLRLFLFRGFSGVGGRLIVGGYASIDFPLDSSAIIVDLKELLQLL